MSVLPASTTGNTLAGGYQVPLIQAADTATASDWIVAEISSFQLDDSRLSRIKGMIEDVRNQMKTKVVEAEMVAAFNDEPAPVSKPAQSKADVIKAANDLLGEAPKTKLADKK